jgi:Domain of Unknown Function with PDB structure (DUF3857)
MALCASDRLPGRWLLPAIGLAALWVLVSTGGSLAQTLAAPTERASGPTSIKLDTTITVRADRTWQTVTTQRVSVLTESALDRAGRQSVSYIESMETLDVVSAYTEKANGRGVPVDPATIVRRDAASGTEVLYRDLKQITLFFPDLAVGDSVVYTVKVEHHSAPYTGHVYENVVFPGGTPSSESTIRIAAPRAVGLRVSSFGAGIQGKRSEDGETIRYALTVAGQSSGSDRTINITTFEDVAAVGRSYWSEARAKMAVTPQVQKLADEITHGISDRRAQAEAMSLWVKRNIRYVAVYLGTARVVPKDKDTRMKNR